MYVVGKNPHRQGRASLGLRHIERRWTEGHTSGLGPRWLYRGVRSREWLAVAADNNRRTTDASGAIVELPLRMRKFGACAIYRKLVRRCAACSSNCLTWSSSDRRSANAARERSTRCRPLLACCRSCASRFSLKEGFSSAAGFHLMRPKNSISSKAITSTSKSVIS